MGSSKKVTVGYRYYMGLHFGLCHGPVDAVKKIVVGERDAWLGYQSASGSIAIDNGNLFGGDKREGGISGTLDVLMGEATQTENSYLVSKLGATIPAFRGILSAVWRGGQVSANNPYIKPWAFRVKRILQGWNGGSAWYPAKAQIAGVICGSAAAITPELAIAGTSASTDGSGGVTYSLSPDDVLIITTTTGLTYEALSRWTSDDNPAAAGNPWDCSFAVKTEDGVITQYRTNRYPTAAAANAAAIAAGPVYITGHSSYTVFIYDTPHEDNRGGASLQIGYASGNTDMNPAHIIYQCLTDTAWGMGYPIGAIDEASFTAAADTLYGEGFGLSMVWNQQDTIESFIKIVLDHIGGMLYVKPDTGYFALKLIRADYDRPSLLQYGPTNLVAADDYQRQAWGETINEITVVYTSACTNNDTAITVQDVANIQTQGGVVAQTRNYPGIRTPDIAQRVALRDLNAVATPLAKIKLTATRAAWAVYPGDVFRLTWPDYDIDDVVYRVLAVNRGTLQNGEIVIDAVEDVFGLPDNTYLVTQGSEWAEPSNAPAAAPYRKLLEAPYWDLVRSLSNADMAYVDALSGYLETLAVRPSGDATNYSILDKIGAGTYAAGGNGDFCPSATIVGALTKTTTALTLSGGIDLDLVTVGGYAVIDNEYVLVTALDATALTATISRGVLDTVPAEHVAGSRIWFSDNFVGFDTTEYAAGETLDVKLLPLTGRGELALADAPADSITFDQRQYRPYPPGNLKFDGAAYPDLINSSSDVVLTWAHRDRLSQTAYIVEQGEASIGPEASTTYSVEVADEALAVLHSATGITAATATVPASALTSGLLRWRVWSVRGGLASYQMHEHWALWGDVRITEDGDVRVTEAGEYLITN